MILLSASNVQKAFGPNTLFENVSFEIAENDRVGFIGVNGAGKTTLFKMMIGEMPLEGGDIYRNKLANIGYMQQHVSIVSQLPLYDEVLSVFTPLMEMEKEMDGINRAIEEKNGDLNQLVNRQHMLASAYEDGGGFLYKSRVRGVLLGLGFAESEFSLNWNALSGGQKTRALLGKLLLCEANLLLLDEPTNHLDIQAVEWLESYLKSCGKAYVVISHDRYFLDKVTARTFELENRHLTVYNGNYSFYIHQKAEDKKTLERRYESTQREIARLEGIIEQQKRWNREKNIVTAKSKQKVIDKLEKNLAAPSSETEGIRFAFANRERGGNDVLTLEEISKSFDGKLLFEDASLLLKRSERVFLLGPNGCGKTTLLKIIMGRLAADSGECRLGTKITAGYYDQTQSDLRAENTVLDEVYNAYPEMDLGKVRTALAAFLFKGDDVYKKISALSGGERARVALLKLMLSKANFLLLDEPTNHLDIESREALEQAFADYDGTLLVVSHDRYFINKIADKIISLSRDGITEYEGGYDAYVEKSSAVVQEAEPVQKKPNEYQQKKEYESAKRKLSGQIARTEAAIQEAEEKLKLLEEETAKPDNASDYEKILELSAKMDETNRLIEEQYALWEKLHGEFETQFAD